MGALLSTLLGYWFGGKDYKIVMVGLVRAGDAGAPSIPRSSGTPQGRYQQRRAACMHKLCAPAASSAVLSLPTTVKCGTCAFQGTCSAGQPACGIA